jgi:hypothetical protein
LKVLAFSPQVALIVGVCGTKFLRQSGEFLTVSCDLVECLTVILEYEVSLEGHEKAKHTGTRRFTRCGVLILIMEGEMLVNVLMSMVWGGKASDARKFI